jgi:altronate dehydratase small subunit
MSAVPNFRVFQIDETDNVATNVADAIPEGTTIQVDGKEITTRMPIPYGHKVALVQIPAGETVRKYGLSIGSASKEIQPGDHVHTHNVESNRGRGDIAATKQEA